MWNLSTIISCNVPRTREKEGGEKLIKIIQISVSASAHNFDQKAHES